MRGNNQTSMIMKEHKETQKRNSSLLLASASPFHDQIQQEQSKLPFRRQRALATENPFEKLQLFQTSRLNNEVQSSQLGKTGKKLSGIQKRPEKRSWKLKRHSSCQNYAQIKHVSQKKVTRQHKFQRNEGSQQICKKSSILYGLENTSKFQNLVSVQKKSLRKQYLQAMSAVIKKHRELLVSTEKSNKQVEIYSIIAQKLKEKSNEPSRETLSESNRLPETLKSQKSTDDQSLII